MCESDTPDTPAADAPVDAPVGAASGTVRAGQVRLAWHDVVCPEAEDCRDRRMHSMTMSIVTSGIAAAFATRLGLTVIAYHDSEGRVQE